jgi:segregation and condensation protein A
MKAAPTWTVHTEVFEGPLDLLLYLVRRDGIDLKRLPVRTITDAYLDYLDRMRELHLGVAGEYLVMAATLCYLKSLELLPRAPTVTDLEDEGADPRGALVRRLREYQRYREGADALESRVRLGRESFSHPSPDEPEGGRPVASPIDAFGLLDLYYSLLNREAAPVPEVAVPGEGPDLLVCSRRVLSWLGGPEGRGELGALLRAIPNRLERIATFVGVLEMARLRWLDLHQEAHLGPVLVEARVAPDIDLTALSDLVTEAAR